jgi:2-keto-4-pentenoate hydratase
MSLDETGIQERAREMLDHRARGIAHPPQPEGARFEDIETAYLIQHAGDRILREEKGYQRIGYKIAAPNAGARQLLGVAEPFFGRIYDRTASRSPAELPPGAGFFHVYEPEIALQMGADLDPGQAPYDAATIEAKTRAVLPAIEIIGTYFSPWNGVGGANLISDNAALGHWVFGAPVEDWSGIDLMEGAASITINGEERARGKGANVDGGVFGATAWLANALARRGLTLKAGDYVTAGSVTAPQPANPGEHVIADLGALGRVEVRVAAG